MRHLEGRGQGVRLHSLFFEMVLSEPPKLNKCAELVTIVGTLICT